MKIQNTKQTSVSQIFARAFGVLAIAGAALAGQARAGEIDWTARDLGGVYKSKLLDPKTNEVFDVEKLELVKAGEKVGADALTSFVPFNGVAMPKFDGATIEKRDFYFVRSTAGEDDRWPTFALEVLKVVTGKATDKPQYKIMTYKVDHYIMGNDNKIKNEVFELSQEGDGIQGWVSRSNKKHVSRVGKDFDPADENH
jgi:hypothetical protein